MKYAVCNRHLRRMVPHDAMILISKASELSNINLSALILSFMNMGKYEKNIYLKNLKKELNDYDKCSQ